MPAVRSYVGGRSVGLAPYAHLGDTVSHVIHAAQFRYVQFRHILQIYGRIDQVVQHRPALICQHHLSALPHGDCGKIIGQPLERDVNADHADDPLFSVTHGVRKGIDQISGIGKIGLGHHRLVRTRHGGLIPGALARIEMRRHPQIGHFHKTAVRSSHVDDRIGGKRPNIRRKYGANALFVIGKRIDISTERLRPIHIPRQMPFSFLHNGHFRQCPSDTPRIAHQQGHVVAGQAKLLAR